MFALTLEMPPTEALTKAKAPAEKAIALDGSLAKLTPYRPRRRHWTLAGSA
jgi:hypothetical protein